MITPLPLHSRSVEIITTVDGEQIRVAPRHRSRYPKMYREMCRGAWRRKIVGTGRKNRYPERRRKAGKKITRERDLGI